jgi:hypothetical protein
VLVVALLGVSSVLAGCGDAGDSHADAPTTTGATSTPTSAGASSTSPATTSVGAGRDRGDFEGQRFDFGAIASAREHGGTVSIEFNRQQVYLQDGSLVSGTQLTEEPVIYGSTDVPYVDQSPTLRRFVLAPDARVLRIADPIPCASEEPMADPVWKELTPTDLVAGAWHDRLMDSLSFGRDGLVHQVRLSAAC